MRYKSRPIVIPYALFLIKCIILTDQWSTGLNKHNQQSVQYAASPSNR